MSANPFSPDYKPQADMRKESEHSRRSRTASKTREHLMQHGTPDQKLQATGYLGPLNQPRQDPRIKGKPSTM